MVILTTVSCASTISPPPIFSSVLTGNLVVCALLSSASKCQARKGSPCCSHVGYAMMAHKVADLYETREAHRRCAAVGTEEAWNNKREPAINKAKEEQMAQKYESRKGVRILILTVVTFLMAAGLTGSIALAGLPSERLGSLTVQTAEVGTRPNDTGSVGQLYSALLPSPNVTCTLKIVGSITASDPVQTGRVFRDGAPDACGVVDDTCAVQFATGARGYDIYTYMAQQNTCITVSLNAMTCLGANFLYSVAYIGAFNPAAICTNYVASSGDSPNPLLSYSFEVNAGQMFSVVVHEVNPGAYCTQYQISITGDVCQPPTSTPTSTATPTPCPITFTDVMPTDYFYEPVRYLYCAGAISGYSDNTFRPYATTTRGQVTKIIVIAFGYAIYTPAAPTFSDVAADHPFYQYVETAAYHNIVSGYSDGTFRPFANVTRGQLSKIVVVAAAWSVLDPPTPTFTDVPTTHPFYSFVETAVCHAVISGYSDGTFRPFNDATRGQISKIAYLAVIDDGSTCTAEYEAPQGKSIP